MEEERSQLRVSSLSDPQKAFIIMQKEDGKPIAALYYTAGISRVTYFN
jgi:hypothetical protein